MYAYLHGKPNYYCSHTFDYLNMEHFLPQFRDLRQKHWIDGMPYHPTVPETRAAEDWPAANVATHKRFDYQYRPDVMEHFSVYYFCAGTKVVAKLQSDTWLWHVATDAETELQRHVRLSDGDRLWGVPFEVAPDGDPLTFKVGDSAGAPLGGWRCMRTGGRLVH